MIRAGPRTERAAWALLAAVSATLLALCVASSGNYSSVVVANATVYAVPRFSVTYQGTAPDGTLAEDGTVRVSISLLAENPSPRTLRFQLVAYGGWIEDWPAEDGLIEERRRTDDRLVDASGTRYFFRAFSRSLEATAEPVPPEGNATLELSFDLTRAADPVRFDAVRNITAYGVARNGTADAVPWNHWIRVALTIDGVLEPTSPWGAAHLRDLRRIEREVGLNLGT